jgi:hypothetical protein
MAYISEHYCELAMNAERQFSVSSMKGDLQQEGAENCIRQMNSSMNQ